MQVYTQLRGDGEPYKGVCLQEIFDVHRKHEELLLSDESNRGHGIEWWAGSN